MERRNNETILPKSDRKIKSNFDLDGSVAKISATSFPHICPLHSQLPQVQHRILPSRKHVSKVVREYLPTHFAASCPANLYLDSPLLLSIRNVSLGFSMIEKQTMVEPIKAEMSDGTAAPAPSSKVDFPITRLGFSSQYLPMTIPAFHNS